MKSKVSIKKLRTAKDQGLLYFRKHVGGDTACDCCGKKNPSYLIIVFENEQEKTKVFEDEKAEQHRGLYLNSFSYIVGSICLAKIKRSLGLKTSSKAKVI